MIDGRRAELWSRALLAALAAGLAIGALAAERVGGDYACFWAAGRLALEGRSPYDGDALAPLERPLLGGDWLPFAWPPAAALAHAGLAWLPFRAAFVAHTAVMFGCALAIPRVLRPILPRATAVPELATVGLLAWPAFRSLTGGQATLALALGVAGTVRLVHDRRPFLAGLAAGAVLLKPTVGVPLAGLAALAAGPWAAAGAGAMAIALWTASAALEGPGWVGRWWAVAWAFQAEAQEVEGAWNVGLLGCAEHLLGYGTVPARIVGATASVVAAVAVSWAWWRGPSTLRLATAGALLPLLPPHAIWYDAGLAGLAVLVLAETSSTAALAGWIGLATVPATAVLGVQPLVGVLPALAVAAFTRR